MKPATLSALAMLFGGWVCGGETRRTMRSSLLSGAALGFSLLAILATPTAAAATDEDAASNQVACCKKGDTTPPTELVKQVPPGGIHSPYDWKQLAKEDPDLVKQFRLPGAMNVTAARAAAACARL